MTEKQRRFVEEYLIDLNATQAAIRAGYSTKRAQEIGYQLLQKTTVRDAIDQAIAERSRRTGVTQERVLRELAKIALVNPLKVIDTETGEVKAGVSEDDAAAIMAVTRKDGKISERSVKLQDKVKALELLGRHLGMFNDKLNVEGAIPVVIKDDVSE